MYLKNINIKINLYLFDFNKKIHIKRYIITHTLNTYSYNVYVIYLLLFNTLHLDILRRNLFNRFFFTLNLSTNNNLLIT